LKGNFDIAEEDTDEVIRKKVLKILKALKVDEGPTLPYLLELLGVRDSGIDRMQASPEGIKERIIDAVRHIILKGARIRPLVIAIEDLHWADKSTEDALQWLLESIPGASVLIIFTYRPEFVHTWGGRSYHNQISLNRLSNRECLAMASYLLDTDDVAPSLQKLILDKTEGIPFFIEESVKSLQGLGLIKKEDGNIVIEGDLESITIPSTIQDMIMARVDRLSDGAKGVLQAGSVIEREFSHELISAVTSLPETELLTHLSSLKDAELLYERGIYPHTSYIFRHALTREVVYGSLLAKRRKELHNHIGSAIEKLFKDDLTERYEILTEHFYQGEDYARAAEYAKRASRKAGRSGSMPDAIDHAEKRVLCLEKLPDSAEAAKERIDARAFFGLYLAQINHLVKARETIEPVVSLARDMGYRKRLCQIQTIMGTYYHFVEENSPKAVDAYEEALHIADEERDILTLSLASYWLGLLRSHDCDFEKARLLIQKAVDINVMAKSLWGIASMKANLAYHCVFYQGKINELIKLSSEALRIAQESGDPMSRGMSHVAYGTGCYAKGDLADAEKNLLDGKLFCERVGLYSWGAMACFNLAEIHSMMNEYLKSKRYYDTGRAFLQGSQIFPSWASCFQLGMAKCGVMLGEKDVNLESLRAILTENRLKLAEGWICRYLADILLNLGESYIAESEQWMQSAVEADENNGLRFSLGLDHALYGDYFKRRGERTKAQEQFGKAVDTLRECGADGWVERYEKELTKL
jgi:tetratricopeptide (TPR) repeat protein